MKDRYSTPPSLDQIKGWKTHDSRGVERANLRVCEVQCCVVRPGGSNFHWSGLYGIFLCSDLNEVSGRAASTLGLCPRQSRDQSREVRGHAPPENFRLSDAPESNFRLFTLLILANLSNI